MKVEIIKKVTYEVKYLRVNVAPRYWQDSDVDGTEDTYGKLIPFRNGSDWAFLIDADTGLIKDWPKGTTADIHYKVCDEGTYALLDSEMKEIASKDGYVPGVMCPGGEGFGDYIIMNIDSDGMIQYWDPEQLQFIIESEN